MNQAALTLDLVERTLDRNLRWIAAADAKIYPIFAIDAAMLGMLATSLRGGGHWNIVMAVASVLAAGALLASVVCLTMVSFPRIKRSRDSEYSVVYFGSAVSRGEAEYVKRLAEGATPSLLEDLARQAYRNAEIAYVKYRAIKWAMILFFLSLPPWLIALALLYQSRVASVIP